MRQSEKDFEGLRAGRLTCEREGCARVAVQCAGGGAGALFALCEVHPPCCCGQWSCEGRTGSVTDGPGGEEYHSPAGCIIGNDRDETEPECLLLPGMSDWVQVEGRDLEDLRAECVARIAAGTDAEDLNRLYEAHRAADLGCVDDEPEGMRTAGEVHAERYGDPDGPCGVRS